MRPMQLDDPLGHLVPPGLLTSEAIERLLIRAMDQRRFSGGHGVPSVPTRYVMTMHPADRAWLDPRTEDRMARVLARRAEQTGQLIIGRIQVEFRAEDGLALGKPRTWVGFAEDDLLVLASPAAVLDVFAGAGARA